MSFCNNHIDYYSNIPLNANNFSGWHKDAVNNINNNLYRTPSTSSTSSSSSGSYYGISSSEKSDSLNANSSGSYITHCYFGSQSGNYVTTCIG